MIMCGIVGLLVKTPALRDQLGALMVPMLVGMSERGPDSAGLAVFGAPLGAAERKYSLYSGLTETKDAFDWAALLNQVKIQLAVQGHIDTKGNHAILTSTVAP